MVDNNKKHWAHKPERGSLFGMYFLVYVFKFLGAGLCKFFMSPVLLYFYLTNKEARKHLMEYLHRVEIHLGYKKMANQWNVFKIIINFGFGMVDRLSSLLGRFSLAKINAINDQDFKKLEERKQGGVLLISHLGNFEICKVASAKKSKAHFNVVVHNENSQKFTEAMQSLSKESTTTLINESELNMSGIIKLKEKVDEGEFVVIAGDRVPVNNEKATVICDFLGKKARFPIGPFVLSKVLACPIITLYCLKNKSKYDVFFKSLTKKIEFNKQNRHEVLSQSVQQYANNLEQHVKIAPLQWYNFHQYWGVNSENENDN